MCQDTQVSGRSEVEEVCCLINQSKNELVRVDGYRSSMWVLGSHGPRVPGSLLQDEEAARLEVQCAAMDPRSQMAKNLAWRESARCAFVKMDNSNTYRKALLRKSRPQRGPFVIGAYVYFSRVQVRPTQEDEVPQGVEDSTLAWSSTSDWLRWRA